MGQQQILLIILGVIVAGIAVIVGIAMFQDNAVDHNRAAVIGDLKKLAIKAEQYYTKPTTLGGGGQHVYRTYCRCNRAGTTCNNSIYE